ncbi:MAG: hypothetical protein ACRESZ_06185 [Methylococcales bacterium]
MPRTIISLSHAEKDWLTLQAEAEQAPMTEIVRRALSVYRDQAEQLPTPNFIELLQNTHGIWSEGEGLDYQNRIRAEWNSG